MRQSTIPIVKKSFISSIGKTAIALQDGQTVWANGDESANKGLLANIKINEVGDTFVATKDSKNVKPGTTEPLFVAGETVTRVKQSIELQSIAADHNAIHFAFAAKAFGLQLNVVM